ncbi:MAG: AzlD domain-containing protein [Propionibacteriaceae bacterium]|jgi:branched-subunit amino acid transport protein|nr:AzlD domain-containing protein [Propionibacteriaceae bacterium]
MSWGTYWVVVGTCAATILASRVLPLLLLKGRQLPDWLSDALGFIPPATFAALVANDLLDPGMFDAGLWPGVIPWLAAIPVVVVALRTRSLLWCIVAGCAAYGLLLLIPSG